MWTIPSDMSDQPERGLSCKTDFTQKSDNETAASGDEEEAHM